MDNKNKQEESLLETILENIPNMIFVKEATDLRFIKFNKAGEELLGYSRDDLIGKNDFDFFPGPEAEFFTSKDRLVLEQGKLLDIPEETIQTAKGQRILHTKKIPIYDSEGNPQYLLGISEDITERKEAEENRLKMYEEQVARKEAEKSIQARDEFISVASHELKAPVSSFLLMVQLFEKKMEGLDSEAALREKTKQFIQKVEHQAQRLNQLVEDMLDISRIRTGRFKMQWEECNLHLLISDIIERMKDQFTIAGYDVPVLEGPKTVVGKWDKLRLEQMIMNLFTNAIRYGKKSKIRVKIEARGSHVIISVHDRGIGIAKKDIDKIFERFERAVDVGETVGMGLGLYITKNIVEAHRGKIWVESAQDRGTVFFVELPIQNQINQPQ